ncbi:peptidylprolyl isomerase [Gaoshiqia sediminis]|uniref:peptidylprolyl isomerase n=1 Tax=Gaoshiqia sediminis TaxID=2986998 RepID=A0AA41Y621_9BACT|nr:peptidylprolyl isomerase [Gaoshiqia sediminis]MCW0481573.1 peptidylprolyl isomerase [Gaoshiqia sediminis]
MKLITRLFILVIPLWFVACSPGEKKSSETKESKPTEQAISTNDGFMGFVPSVVRIESFDQGRFLESETAFFVDSNLVVCRLAPLLEATDALITPLDETKKFKITGFVAIDRINDLILLQTEGIIRRGLPLHEGIAVNGEKSLFLAKPQNNTLPLHRGQITGYGNVKGSMRYHVSNQFRSQYYGTPVFLADGACIGLGYSEVIDYENQPLVIPSTIIKELMRKANREAQPLTNIKTTASKAVSEANSKIKGLLLETDLGNIRIRLSNETPEYRDNFIALVNENYYDSLLIHRVIKGFCIQSGAADTRYAGKDDIVGWKGPGYTLPAHIVPKFFHKRGMIGSPRKPDRGNSKRRSDGSQFYIVTGRTYSDQELNEIEKETGYRFSANQRQVYKTIGGAPHIDGSYTIFGEVVDGMNVADKINQLPVDSDFRPLQDIRLRKITIIK